MKKQINKTAKKTTKTLHLPSPYPSLSKRGAGVSWLKAGMSWLMS